MKVLFRVSLAGLLLLLACRNGKQTTALRSRSASPSHLNGEWELTYLTGAEIDSLFPGKKPELHFDLAASHVTGNTGCNSFAGPFKIDGRQIDFDQSFAITKMFCPGTGEQVFLQLLKRSNAWSIRDGIRLELRRSDTLQLSFSRM